MLNKQGIKPGDIVLIAVLVAVLLLGGAWWLLSKNANTGLVVVCQTKEGFYRVDSLLSDVEYTVESGDGKQNFVQIQNGQVDVTSATCKNQVCVNHDPISKSGEQIVCLPHGMVIEVAQSEQDVAKLE